jgi:hypothetical protein
VHAYRFADFDAIQVVDQASAKTIEVGRDDLEAFRVKKKKYEEVVS